MLLIALYVRLVMALMDVIIVCFCFAVLAFGVLVVVDLLLGWFV